MEQTPRPIIAVLCPTDGTRPAGMTAIEMRAEVRYVAATGLSAALADAQALFMWDFFSPALRGAWSSAGALQWIHVAAAGVDTLMFDELAASDIVVTNARGIFDRPIAEYVLGSILAFAKDLHRSHDLQLRREWRHRETRTVAGSTALIVGTGSIGREIARLLRSVGIDVTGAGRRARTDDPDFGRVVASSELVHHVGGTDHLVVVAPLTDSTRGLVNDKVLSALKPGSHLVNVGRGPVVDEDALRTALAVGQLASATLDVFDAEPLPEEHPLWTTPGVVITPHMAGDAMGWRNALAAQFVTNALNWLDGHELMNIVDKTEGFVAHRARWGDERRPT